MYTIKVDKNGKSVDKLCRFGRFLDRIAKDNDMNWKELAVFLGVKYTTLHNWKTGRAKPGMRHIKHLSGVLKMAEVDVLIEAYDIN